MSRLRALSGRVMAEGHKDILNHGERLYITRAWPLALLSTLKGADSYRRRKGYMLHVIQTSLEHYALEIRLGDLVTLLAGGNQTFQR